MLYWVMYDISNNRDRNRAVKACKNKGLYRVQKSIFLGELNKNQKDELKIMMEQIVNENSDSKRILKSIEIYEEDIIQRQLLQKQDV